MFVKLEELDSGWAEVSIGLKKEEIDILINNLKMLKEDITQHFHCSSDYERDKGLGHIEFYLDEENRNNMKITSLMIEPTR
ncbi:MAG: hypothetical protein A2381_15085 [Bdellovibrionales bacterium RIFOXYB1_FULL_37_110]|nr:MAG: hypothetical protein A2417_10590 [Bdellovibrionales bacterium RIFOXYC1_FULL_37_79]OFZ60188.1 MAG: hypothetical protein A2381_15085 [Bdellovibrionales bacterium RIFOXYB1_FULL_37_110]OFZ64318.1 MAG: hypothetical protein A2577_09685 [Bdellovibrionales bacterium RIFOXYD1_FULL_36_51]